MAKTYDTYKDCGIAWIGNIPSEWKTCRIKDTSLLYTGNSIKDEEKDSFQDMNEARPYIATKDIDATYMSANYNNGLYIKHTDCNFRIAPPSSTLMCIEGGSAGRKKAFIDQEDSLVNKLCRFAPFEGVYGKYIHYFLCSQNFEDIFNSKITRLIGGVNIPTLKNIECLLPSISEQKAIATYLDKKCGEIDSLISLQEEMISELQAYKQSVITEAVTKGLDSNVPMKDSGVEWIGTIPEGWNVSSLKHIINGHLQYGANESGTLFEEGLPRYVRITDILDNKLREDIQKQSLTEEQASGFILQDKDILFARSGGTVGKSFIYRRKYGRCAFAGYLIKAAINQKNDADFIYYYTLSSSYDEWKKRIFIQATIQNIGADKYSLMEIPLPPLSEQQAIASYLDEKTSQIDSLIALKLEKITELKDYKKSIIYEYVTGKKKV